MKGDFGGPTVSEQPNQLLTDRTERGVRVLASGPIFALVKGNQFDQATILQATESLTAPQLGEGLAKIQAANPDMATAPVLQALGASGAAIPLDTLGRTLDAATLADLTKQIVALAKAGGNAPTKIAALIDQEAGITS